MLITDSRIDGDFEGWDGDRVFELPNGQKWQQVRYRYRYRYRYSPRARVYNKGGRYYLEVEGMDEAIEVRRVR